MLRLLRRNDLEMNLDYITELFDESGRVWSEEEIQEVKLIAKLLIRAGFPKKQTADWLGLSASSIYNWTGKLRK